MRSVLNMLLVCTTVFTACVDKENPAEDGSGNKIEKYSVPLPSSTENGKAEWVPGDELVIHGEYSKDQLTVTLTADDISEDGKTCYVPVEGVTPYDQKTTKIQYYIAYPGDMVKNDSHCKDASKFNGTNGLLLAGYNKDKTFIVESLVGGFTFTVSGDFDSYELKGNNNETVGYSSLKCTVTENTKLYAQAKGTSQTTVSGAVAADGKSINHICFSGDFELSDGLMMTFYKNGNPVKKYTVERELSVKRDVFTSLGNITSELADYKDPASNTHMSAIPTNGAKALDVEETANCYIVSEPGIYSFKTVKGNSAEGLGYISSVEILWESWGTTEDVIPNSVISKVDFEKDRIYFRIATDYHPGNALLAAKDENGKIVWSWHIWVPETSVGENLYGLSRHMTQDRNLGALVVASEEGALPESAGLFYQWGRKDPFVGVGDFSTGEPASVAGQEMTLAGGQMTTIQSVKNPTVFADNLDGHWNSLESAKYWDQKKTVYDPCPSGYKVPYGSEYLPFSNSLLEIAGWDYKTEYNVLAVGSPSTTYPLGGYVTTDGSYAQYGEGTRIWSSRPHSSSANAYNFRIFETDGAPSYGNGSKPKSNGFAVRCVRHNATPFENAPGTPIKGKYTKYDVDIVELSGLCLHTDKSFIWGVGDQGRLSKISFDGTVEKVLGQALDMEGVTINPATGDLYLGCEPNWVGIVKAPDYKIATEIFRIDEADGYGNSGIEGISWYKDDMLLVGTQIGAYMWACKLDGTVVWKKSIKTVAIGCQEIADICYDPVKDQIWIIDSETQSIYLLNGDATEHLATYRVNFAGNCESVCLDYGNDCVWIADDDDASELFKIDFEF